MFVFRREESFRDRVRASFVTKAKMFIYTLAIAKVLTFLAETFSTNDEENVPCYKVHSCTAKITASTELNEAGKRGNAKTQHGRNVLLPRTQVEALKSDEELRRMLYNNALRRVLLVVASASDPVAELTPYMQDEFFSNFVTRVLNTLSAVESDSAINSNQNTN
ncbi:hypothetical protein X943_000699 [Babesia divergens]|uniref:Uncharacterized protein n=1 Tax=Babesia divergens TaxID=32595 RepID=A0AAD9GKS1_BABDI|nr:hypothetical protein X943_000699 [Babesia divergens]